VTVEHVAALPVRTGNRAAGEPGDPRACNSHALTAG
jgi:hypothetical protein